MTIDELEECARIVLRHARESGIGEVPLDGNDFYWTIGSPAWLAIYETPEPIVGSLCDDEAELAKVLNNPARATAVDLDRVASLLRMVSDQLAR